ncbi:alpha-L-fucosidase [Sandaracinobacteroides saxicola]|uniref:alpha-L-fucosidase n=1 Tax=Sandaracinobacteroides saxicola TaxID=2759707 RepID=A0A7G5ILR5_9SPHN|nr:alpha-L-fucosidase [Sandaracinobacteroides saxicola]QMW24307.1 alpha-L-fucosidase [Sandaracinobacteroides saxicola]
MPAHHDLAAGHPRYLPVPASLNHHPLPAWFQQAKLGIFVHWGLYSVPAFAPRGPNPNPAAPDANAFNPYAEWYANTMQFPGSETAAYHRTHFGDAPYADFTPAFETAAANADYTAWARTFAASGARYVILVTKHHDGYPLWPTAVPNPHRPGWHCQTDVVGKLAAAVRAENMRFGIYYSGGLDWTFNPARVDNARDMLRSMPHSHAYDSYVAAHYRELIAHVRPDYLWNDVGYPVEQSSFALMADFYNGNPDGLVNDRWLGARELLTAPPEQQAIRMREFGRYLAQHRPPPPPHYDVITPEYAADLQPLEKPWEATRGIGFSFGYNANEPETDLLAPNSLVALYRRIVASGGNLLLNVGPRGDGSLCPMQVARLHALGESRH